jgi:hypothetical protein
MYNLWQAFKDLVTGNLKKASPEIASNRMAICNKCEAYDSQLKLCTACGCFMTIKTKLEKAECPMEKW